MIRFLLNTLNCILLFVQLILAIIAIVAITNISKDASGSVAVIVISLIFMIPIGFIMHYISKKTKVNVGGAKKLVEKSVQASPSDDEDLMYKLSQLHKKLRPEFEIRYRGGDGKVSVEKIIVLGIRDNRVEAYSFARCKEHTFYLPGIEACVEISTGELINENLMVFFTQFLYPRRKLSRIFDYEEWCYIPYVVIPEGLPGDLCFFKIDQTLHARIVTYQKGVVEDDFYFGKIVDSYYESDQYYIEVKDSRGNKMNVGFSKILSVENRNFVEYLLEEFSKANFAKE